jgi:uncharacterized membrane protein AbrB (regulator of aidB expression)
MNRHEASWIVGFAGLFGGAMVLRTIDLPGATELIPAGLLFGVYCAWVALPLLRKRPARRKPSTQVLAGAIVGASIGLQLTGSLQPALLGAVLGVVAGFVADLWVPHVQLP